MLVWFGCHWAAGGSKVPWFPSYPQSTSKALFVESVDGCQDLKELQDALLVVQAGELLKRLLDLFPQRFGLKHSEKEPRYTLHTLHTNPAELRFNPKSAKLDHNYPVSV